MGANPATHCLSLPEIARTRSGIQFFPRQDRWAYREGVFNVRLNFSAVTGVTGGFIFGLKSTFIWYAENRASTYLVTCSRGFVIF